MAVTKVDMSTDINKQTAAATDPATARWRGLVGGLLKSREASIFIAGILLIIYFQLTAPVFLSGANIAVLMQYTAATAIIAIGSAMVLITRELDLSVGSVYALTPFIMYFSQQAGLPTVPAVIVALLVAGAIGWCNGAITVYLRVPAFVTTLGALFLIKGVTLKISGGFPVQADAGAWVSAFFGNAAFSGIVWAIVIAIIFQVVLSKSRWGLHTIATGGNPTGAAEVGIKTSRIRIGNFVMCSMLGGLAGVLDSFRIGSINPLAGGNEIMFMGIAAAVIGGTLLTGGSGTIIGAFIGALVLAILKDGFTISGVSAYTFNIILGAAIVITMMANIHVGRLRIAGGKK